MIIDALLFDVLFIGSTIIISIIGYFELKKKEK